MGCCMSAARVNSDSHDISKRYDKDTHGVYEPGPGKVRSPPRFVCSAASTLHN
jgi:hypothetical protein